MMRIVYVDVRQLSWGVVVGIKETGKPQREYVRVTRASVARISSLVFRLALNDCATVAPWITGYVGWNSRIVMGGEDNETEQA